jgi:hypothetical protein
MADIQASAGITTQEFSTGLQDALTEARAWRKNIEKSLSFEPLKKGQVANVVG